MSFIPLNNKSRDIPIFDSRILKDILEMQIKPFNSMENINYLGLLVFLCPLILPHVIIIITILRRPVFQLKKLPWGKETYNSCPFIFCEALHTVNDFKCDILTVLGSTDSFYKCFFELKSFIFILLYVFSPYIVSVSQQLDCVFEAYVSWIVWGWNNNYWSTLMLIIYFMWI